MGLDITVLGKPLDGHEAEFDTLLRQLAIAHGVMPDNRPKPALWARLIGQGPKPPTQAQIARQTARFNEIAVPAYAVLGAPVVGQDPAVDAWARDTAIRAGKPVAEALSRMAGYHVLELMADCDGLPPYTNGGMGYHVDHTSFRGAFLDACKDALPEADRLAVWQAMTAPELQAYGQRVANHARAYAETTGLTGQLGQRNLIRESLTPPEAELHIVDSLARWATFWGSRGHGSWPDF